MADVQYFLKSTEQHDRSLIEIPKGKITIGRGPFLECTEKRVSRSHAELELTDDGHLYVTSIHTNPTFFKQNGHKNHFESLEKGKVNELHEGDCISLLPNSCIFEIASKRATSSCRINRDTVEENNNQSNLSMDSAVENSALNVQDTADQIINRKRKLPDWSIAAANCDQMNSSESIKPKIERKKQSKVSAIKNEDKTKNNDKLQDYNSASSSKVKLENLSIGEETVLKDMEHEEPSSEKAVDTSNSDSVVDSSSSVKRRPPCQYGGKCYRKNPDHREEYSHPGDRDFENSQNTLSDDDNDDNRPECEYGTDCYRKNPLHKQQYKHTKKPLRKAVIKAKKRKEATDEFSDEDEYDESFIDDDSDNYDPKKDDAEYSSDDEDLAELNAEAKAFVKNKKM